MSAPLSPMTAPLQPVSAPLLSVEDLAVTYAARDVPVEAVRGVSFAIRPGERFGIVGESGSGKSTLALAMLRVLAPGARIDRGRIVLEGHDLLRLRDRELRAVRWERIALIPQGSQHALNPVMRVGAQIADAIDAHPTGSGGVTRNGAHVNDGMRRRIGELLEAVGLPATVARAYPHELSGGMRQRACIAMAIALGPRVLVADEPTSALDVVTQRVVIETIRRVQSELSAALILIGHDLALQAQVVDRIAVMHAGRFVEVGPVREIFCHAVHPYTQRLLAAVPSIRDRRRPLAHLAPLDWTQCALGAACANGFERHEVSPEHYVRCDRAHEEIAYAS
jgi:peptide/nickel transport system ATP-binding protein